eukprot:1197926-Rhodomonas_salina.2
MPVPHSVLSSAMPLRYPLQKRSHSQTWLPEGSALLSTVGERLASVGLAETAVEAFLRAQVEPRQVGQGPSRVGRHPTGERLASVGLAKTAVEAFLRAQVLGPTLSS